VMGFEPTTTTLAT